VLRSRVTIDQHLQSLFPLAPLRPLGDRNGVDMMVAGCGTGQHPIGMARQIKDVRMLAIDLSLNSLCYAKRKTQEIGLHGIEYAQADILQLDLLDRSFDVIDAGGVLHHMTDPTEGWRKLLTLLRPGGFMRVSLYSELGRADVVAARRFIAERNFGSTAEAIRRCRQDILGSRLQTIASYGDFFTTSECRDMLFHVQEQRLTIPQIQQFLTTHGLRFIGFEVDTETAAAYRARFAHDQAMMELDHWHTFETGRPATFAAMYKFWCQR
jgi:ubiquinone/menaquinone biosynthesis C-methylase UbiE